MQISEKQVFTEHLLQNRITTAIFYSISVYVMNNIVSTIENKHAT